MQIIVSGHNISMTSALQDYSQKKIGKLDTFFHEALEKGKVELEHHSNKSPDKQNEAKVSVHVHGAILAAKEEHSDMYAAIDLIFEKLEKQLKKYKNKMKDRRREKTSIAINDIILETENPTDEDRANPIVYKVTAPLKPMFEEEAVLQLQLGNMEFLTFLNAETEKMNVIYRRNDGDFGLIQPI
ncbi:MAG: ribosome-associated translation inhibitor RaiA [Candidatus Riflemargulisbacteria bacterium]